MPVIKIMSLKGFWEYLSFISVKCGVLFGLFSSVSYQNNTDNKTIS